VRTVTMTRRYQGMKENRMEDLVVRTEPSNGPRRSPTGWSMWCALRTVRSCSRWGEVTLRMES
jgi:hypothetical protein